MWKLTSTDFTLWLPLPTHTPAYSVGRKECDILLTSDKSVSRRHAEFEVTGGMLRVKDLESKYGSTLNGTRLSGESRVLSTGDRVKLGQTEFSVQQLPLVLCASGLRGVEKGVVDRAMADLGVSLVAQWSTDVTHLIMTHVSFTPKLLTALASAVPVVTPEWVRLLAARRQLNEKPPDPDAFPPSVPSTEGSQASQMGGISQSVGVRQETRRHLFAGWDIVWLPKAMGTGAAANDMKTSELLLLMGARELPWANHGDTATFLQAHAPAALAYTTHHAPRSTLVPLSNSRASTFIAPPHRALIAPSSRPHRALIAPSSRLHRTLIAHASSHP